jgi:hypothetical protein
MFFEVPEFVTLSLRSTVWHLPLQRVDQTFTAQDTKRYGATTVAHTRLVDGEVIIDEAGGVYLVDETSDGAGFSVRRQTLRLQAMGDGRMITDNGPTYVRPFAVQPGEAQIQNGRFELPTCNSVPAFQS